MTDGLPVVPSTPERLDWTLAGTALNSEAASYFATALVDAPTPRTEFQLPSIVQSAHDRRILLDDCSVRIEHRFEGAQAARSNGGEEDAAARLGERDEEWDALSELPRRLLEGGAFCSPARVTKAAYNFSRSAELFRCCIAGM